MSVRKRSQGKTAITPCAARTFTKTKVTTLVILALASLQPWLVAAADTAEGNTKTR